MTIEFDDNMMDTSVQVTNLSKSYGSSSNRVKVLKNLKMTVKRGSIYSLMGASGCGKTTLLSCIVGMISPDKGNITVLDEKLVHNRIPSVCSKIGYLPQETALINELTVKETIHYFGNIFQMDKELLDERYEMLKSLLDLPEDCVRIENCSGGEQRRISFAAALIHNPDLLILDEPTVGLDPILRDKIWNFLVKITRETKISVIITTHYIEEARQADICALMRNGILLEEDKPLAIMEKYKCETLEQAFLKLCVKQIDDNQNIPQVVSSSTIEPLEASQNNEEMMCKKPSSKQKLRSNFTYQTMKALVYKNFIQLIRSPSAIINMVIVTVLNIGFFYWAVGANPTGLRIGIVNDEIFNHQECKNSSLLTAYAHDYTCDLNKISCRFIDEISDEYSDKIYFNNFEDAYKQAKKGKLKSILHIKSNFTESTYAGLIENVDEFAPERNNQFIDFYVDRTDFQLYIFLERKILQAYDNYSKSLMKDCGFAMKIGSSPLVLEKPIYGNLESNFKLFMAPIFLMVVVFFQSLNSNSSSICDDRKNGLWNRTMLSGVTPAEVLFSHFFVQLGFNTFQILEILVFLSMILETTDIGKLSLIAGFLFLLLLAGTGSGMAISCIIEDHSKAYNFNNFLLNISITVSGIIWPLEGMHPIIKFINYCFPFTLPSISAKDIIFKGYGIENYSVYIGYVFLFFWTSLFCIIAWKTVHLKKFSRNT